jgi:ABC-type branched-subunit amino acid transport system substrate-binding protein
MIYPLQAMVRSVAAMSVLLLAASSASAQSPLRVGWNSELSGAWTFSGKACLDAARLAESEVNAGGKKIELVLQDNQTNPAQAAVASRALDTQEKVDMLSGPTNADTSLAVYGYAEENKVPLLVPVAAFPRLTRPGTKYTFRIEPDAVGWGYAAIKFIKTLKPGATIGIIVNDFAVNRAVLAGLKYQAERDDIKIVSEIVFPQSASDATVQAAQMKAKRPDYVITSGGAGAFDVTLTNQLLDVGFKADQLYHPYGSTKQILAWGPRSVGSYFGTFFDHNLPNLTEVGKKFVENFRKASGYPPGYVENYCYSTIYILKELIDAKKTGSREAIRAALSSIDTKEITTGIPIRFDQNGARIEYMYLQQVQTLTKEDFVATKVNYMEWSPEALPVYELAP